MNVTFITGNQGKADYLAQYLGFPVDHQKVDADELQSLDMDEIVRHKVLQAYSAVRGPVLVEDVGLEFTALGRLPGPFIKWFWEELSPEAVCALLDGKDRRATAYCTFGYYDGQGEPSLFRGSLPGRIADKPAGDGGYGWDKIFVPQGYDKTRAQLGPEDYRSVYLSIKPLVALREFLTGRHAA